MIVKVEVPNGTGCGAASSVAFVREVRE